MKGILENYKNVVVQIATPYSTGTGFYLPDYKLIITNEHVIRDNKKAIIHGAVVEKQLCDIVYLDQKYDIAFLRLDQEIEHTQTYLAVHSEPKAGDPVMAIGHPFGLAFSATRGIVSSTVYDRNDIHYIQHDAALNPGNSGGPLINEEGKIIGVNTFIIKNGNNIGFSLPVEYLKNSLDGFLQIGFDEAVRCASCSNIIGPDQIDGKYCGICGSYVLLPSHAEEYEPIGIASTIEQMLLELDYEVELTRRGPNNWGVQKGSAMINISYYEKTGLITGDAYLCYIPDHNIDALYIFLLEQNYKMDGVAFSVKGNDIILSLLIFDQYLNSKTALHLFNYLFEKADEYDDVLVDQFGARWRDSGN